MYKNQFTTFHLTVFSNFRGELSAFKVNFENPEIDLESWQFASKLWKHYKMKG